MPINSRSKGNRNERLGAELFTTWTGKKFARTPSSGGLSWKSSNSKGDIVSTEEGFYFPLCIEIKAHKEIDFSHLLNPKIKLPKIKEFWQQCKRDAKLAEKIPILLMRYDNMPKGLFFVMLHKKVFEYCLEPFWYSQKAYLEHQTEKEHTVILPSTWFFSIPYKRIKGILRNYNKNRKEQIKPIGLKGFNYSVSNRGYLINNETLRKIYGSPNNKGILVTVLNNKGERKTITIYRWVARLFVKNSKNLPIVNHVKPLKSITDARNLEWVTHSENTKHHFDNVSYGYQINKIDPKTGEVLGIYNSPILAARSVGKKSGSTITKVLNGKRQTAYNFKWTKTH